MALRIRLMRMGARNRPYYRVVVAESSSPRSGKFVEVVGTYDPTTDPARVSFRVDRIREWIAKGAKPTKTVDRLLKREGVL